ncbi:MAG: ABC transporter ATP-binding protein, partial [Anaerolinea sp.]|nr:ABC transporter ATP-binding protein [Anaerolinea sp.]
MRTLKFVFAYTRRYLSPLSVTVVSMVLLVGVQLLTPWIIKSMVGLVTNAPVPDDAGEQIAGLAILALAVFIARGVLRFLRSYMAHVAGWGVVADARQHIYEHLQKLSLRFYEDKQTGQLMSRTVNDSDLFEQLIAHAVPDILVNVLMFAGVTVVLALLNWQLLLLSMLPIPFILLSMQIYAKRVRPAFRNRQKELADLNATLADNLAGIREIKAFTRETIEAERIKTHIQHYRNSLLRALRLMATFEPFIEFTSSLGTIVVIFFGGHLALSGHLRIEDLVAFFLYLDMFYQPVRVLSGSWEQIQQALAGGDRVEELLNEPVEAQDRPGSIVLTERAKGALSFKDVRFRYSRGDIVLDDITLDIPAGSITALVGPTGVGKTTFVSLIPRFYDVTDGAITLDGRDIRDIRLDSLRRQISIVLQDVFLFHGTVRENILFGRPGASDAEIEQAA